MSTAGLRVGDDLDLLSDVWHDDGYLIEALAGADFGGGASIEVVLSSLLRDGAIVAEQGKENREVTIPVRVKGADLLTLALGEAALALAAGKRTTLTYTPPDGIGVPTVFPVWTSSLQQPFDDLAELRNERTYLWRFVCEPSSRSERLTVMGSQFVSDDIDIADECESTTGWSVYGSGASATITVDSTAGHFISGTGAVKLVVEPYIFDSTPTTGGAYVDAKIRKSGLSIDATGGGYFIVRHRPEPGWELNVGSGKFFLTTSGGGRDEVSVVAQTAEENGFTRYALTIPDLSTITTFEYEGQQTSFPPPGSLPPNPSWHFDAIGIADGASENQAARSMEIGGSARSEGSLAVSAAVGLGDVLLYTAPDLGDGFRPDLRRWQSAGSSPADAAAINGSYVPANTGVFEAPAATLRHGDYVLLARVRSTGSTSFTLEVEAQTVLEGTPIGATSEAGGSLAVDDTSGYHVVRVGVLGLPPHVVDTAADAVVRFTLSGTSTCRVDELLIFPLEDAALTWVECGSGSPSATVASRLWIDAPSETNRYGQVLIGNDELRSDARYVQPLSKGRHTLYPGSMLAYLLTSAAGGADLATSYFQRWHTWAAAVGDGDN